MGGAIHDTLCMLTRREPTTYAVALGAREEQNLYTAELAAIAIAMRCLPHNLVGRRITIFTSNIGALLAVSQPRHQSGQASIEEIYGAARSLRKGGNSISLAWILSQGDFDLNRRAKESLEHDFCSIYHRKDVKEDTCHIREPQDKMPDGSRSTEPST
jgi:hypothetical protein